MIKKAILKLGLLFALVGLPYLGAKIFYVTNYDVNYYKAGKKANHLVLGLSRAKRGISPAILKEELKLNGQMLNFAFNNMESPYGEAYFQAIQKKVIETEKNGLFILSVCPGAIMDLNQVNGSTGFREESFFFYNLWCQNCSPNVEYVLRSPVKNESLFQFLHSQLTVALGSKRANTHEMIHADGWAELDPKMRYKRSKPLILKRTFSFSSSREKYLSETITFLQKQGTVVLVRLPVGKTFLEYEKTLYPSFDAVMTDLAAQHKVSYLNYVEADLGRSYHDGHHLFSDDARVISFRLAEDLKSKIIH